MFVKPKSPCMCHWVDIKPKNFNGGLNSQLTVQKAVTLSSLAAEQELDLKDFPLPSTETRGNHTFSMEKRMKLWIDVPQITHPQLEKCTSL